MDVYISRDLDSRVNSRERAAVGEWLNSTEDFHFMRDHPLHGTTILGSGWGSKLHRQPVRDEWQRTWMEAKRDPIFWADRSKNGPDQVLLDK